MQRDESSRRDESIEELQRRSEKHHASLLIRRLSLYEGGDSIQHPLLEVVNESMMTGLPKVAGLICIIARCKRCASVEGCVACRAPGAQALLGTASLNALPRAILR